MERSKVEPIRHSARSLTPQRGRQQGALGASSGTTQPTQRDAGPLVCSRHPFFRSTFHNGGSEADLRGVPAWTVPASLMATGPCAGDHIGPCSGREPDRGGQRERPLWWRAGILGAPPASRPSPAAFQQPNSLPSAQGQWWTQRCFIGSQLWAPDTPRSGGVAGAGRCSVSHGKHLALKQELVFLNEERR